MRHPILTLGLLLSLTPSIASAQAVDPARATVQQLNDDLIRVMKAGGTVQTRTAALGPALDRAFDLPLMTRLAVGPAWTSLNAADQQALTRSFRRMTISQYARNFDSWSGESFTMDPQVQQRGGDKLVRTTLNVPKQAPVAISYRLRQSGNDWKIIDVFYRNAISQIATRRSDFASVLQKGGAASLVAHMDAIAAKGEKF
ncbi:phospholipid transport system substrate-binding protein [Novosphingobium sp. PhB165]|uniref:ABC transporter substrate-binding protein n=1 Tax=Novosphingobium sp. PhB165 TaxID=2485105 RepID=UPI00105234FD|nr:ABC transporter substrate-binding protein [Novosphingobium sp. PhB165]TCM16063.1 phospholipid transport system substrate-binding protein [Novosphingobium sp. PhB165]